MDSTQNRFIDSLTIAGKQMIDGLRSIPVSLLDRLRDKRRHYFLRVRMKFK